MNLTLITLYQTNLCFSIDVISTVILIRCCVRYTYLVFVQEESVLFKSIVLIGNSQRTL